MDQVMPENIRLKKELDLKPARGGSIFMCFIKFYIICTTVSPFSLNIHPAIPFVCVFVILFVCLFIHSFIHSLTVMFQYW